jgi:hypothetical protein
MTFTGIAADINAALDGLLFQPDADYQGSAMVQLITDDLGNSGAGGVLNTMDNISISVNGNTPPSDNLPPLDEIIIDFTDPPGTEPDPVPATQTTEPEVEQEVIRNAKVDDDDISGSSTPVNPAARDLPFSGDVSVHESIVSAGANPEQGERSSVYLRVWNAIADPLVSLQALATIPPGALIWEFIDQMTDQINMDDSALNNKTYLLGTTATGVTFAFSAGYVSWLLRAGYLSAALLTSAPMWRQFDPLPILAKHEKKKPAADKDNQDSGQDDDSKVEEIFDPSAHSGADEAVK